jgi:cytidylate kinase
MLNQPMIVAIDGPAGAGKSTVAKVIAARLGYVYLESGVLYRAMAWKALTTGTDPTSPDAMHRLCKDTRLQLVSMTDGGVVVEADGRILTDEIRTPEVSRAASQVAALPEVRTWLLPVQQALRRQEGLRGIVAEGRDIGTRIFPEASAKFFLEAAPSERARRRHTELLATGRSADLSDTQHALDDRDRRDQTRESAPLASAPDAVAIDTTHLSVEEVVEHIERLVAARSSGET